VTIEDYIAERNKLYLQAESRGPEVADQCWSELGVANRHISRVLDGTLTLIFVECEIERCLRRVREILKELKRG